ncbi:MAG: hypothetical protein QN122_01220 [Armatimonadota bacterium]|nr:hypothetical protein [Armatimonadota bacterium]MDR7490064.1 hypothetical protein [Armatimonadota bacterium]MDR7585320.1 hypothetical protein [Armatimonadota bacterium]
MGFMRVLAALIGVLLCATAAVGQTVRGDVRAWQEISAAWERLSRLKTYRMRVTSSGQPAPSVVERVNPDRSRMVMKQGEITIESITVGKETRFRMAGPGMLGTWQCQGALPKGAAPAQPPQPGKAEGEITVRRLGPRTVAGVSTQAYEYATSGKGGTTTQRLYVGRDGLPRRLELLGGKGGQPVTTVDYYDFNAPITIPLPACS